MSTRSTVESLSRCGALTSAGVSNLSVPVSRRFGMQWIAVWFHGRNAGARFPCLEAFLLFYCSVEIWENLTSAEFYGVLAPLSCMLWQLCSFSLKWYLIWAMLVDTSPLILNFWAVFTNRKALLYFHRSRYWTEVEKNLRPNFAQGAYFGYRAWIRYRHSASVHPERYQNRDQNPNSHSHWAKFGRKSIIRNSTVLLTNTSYRVRNRPKYQNRKSDTWLPLQITLWAKLEKWFLWPFLITGFVKVQQCSIQAAPTPEEGVCVLGLYFLVRYLRRPSVSRNHSRAEFTPPSLCKSFLLTCRKATASWSGELGMQVAEEVEGVLIAVKVASLVYRLLHHSHV